MGATGKRRRPAALTPRSVRHLTEQGYLVGKVEQQIPRTWRKRDLFGIVDLLALREHTVAVQVTDSTSVARRVKKILASPHLLRLRAAGWRVQVHGWARPTKARRRWALRVVDVEAPEAGETVCRQCGTPLAKPGTDTCRTCWEEA